ncbi:MAG: hypothetical protein IPM06_21925 [Rhizobiales bacterium]|nr:hypothetical protein [Hyphomicrobiales bacterium]
MAVAAYRERSVDTVRPDGSVWHQVRTHKNVRALRSFFMDLDVDAGNRKKFAKIAGKSLRTTVAVLCGNPPVYANRKRFSGGGVHILSLENHIQPEARNKLRKAPKSPLAHHKFRADPACTSDLARVLRPV